MAGNRTFTVTVRINADGTAAAQGVKKTETAFSRLGNTLKTSLLPTLASVTAIFAGLTAAFVQGARDAFAYDRELRRLGSAFRDIEQADPTAGLVKQAEALSVLTGAADTAVLSAQALIAQLGATPEQTQKATQAAVDLSAAFGITLESAARNVGRTLGGFAGELNELVPELELLGKEALRAGAGIDLLAERFAGTAEATRNVQTGFANLRNALSDFVHTASSAPAESQALLDFLDALAGGLRENQNEIPDFVRGLGVLGNSVGVTSERVGILLKSLTLLTNAFPPVALALGVADAMGELAAKVGDLGEASRLAAEAQEKLESELERTERQQRESAEAAEANATSHRGLLEAFDNLIRQSPEWQREIQKNERALEADTAATQGTTEATERLIVSQERLARTLPETTRELERQAAAQESFVVGQGLGGSPLFPGLSGATYTYTTRRSVPTENGGVRFVQNFATRRFGV